MYNVVFLFLKYFSHFSLCLPKWHCGKESACQWRRHKRCGFNPWVRKIPWRWEWLPTPIFLPGKFHGQRSLGGYSPWGHKESDMTEYTHTHTQACTFPLSIKDNLEYHYVHKVFIHLLRHNLSLVQFSSSAMSDSFWPMDYSMPGLPVHHQLLEYTQTHVHWVTDAIQPSHPLSSPSPTFNISQYQGLFQWVSSSHQVAKVLELQLQYQSFQWILNRCKF